jgi:hypothetical protein
MPYPEGRADVSALTGNQTSGGAPPRNDFMIEGFIFIVADLSQYLDRKRHVLYSASNAASTCR